MLEEKYTKNCSHASHRNYCEASFKIYKLGDFLKNLDDLQSLFLVGGSVY